MCIYQLKSIVNNKIYIGSTIDFNARIFKHFSELKRKAHHSTHLQNHINKHGLDVLEASIIEIINNKKDLIIREQYYLDTLHPEFNICKIAGNILGTKRSKKVVEKVRLKNLGSKRTPEQCKKMSERLIGTKRTKESIEKQLASRKGFKHSEESKEKIRQWHLGKKPSQKTRDKISKGKKGRGYGEEVRQKMSKGHKGLKNSPETCEKIRQSKLGRKFNKETRKFEPKNKE